MKIIKIEGRSPYAGLHCPFCGSKISHPDLKEFGDCPHLVGAFIDDEENLDNFEANDICFELFEPAPTERSHFIVFRP